MKIGILTLKGMGEINENYSNSIIKNIKKHLNADIELVVYQVPYYVKHQNNQDRLMKDLGKMKFRRLRNFIISALGDVGTIGYQEDEYKHTMHLINNGIENLRGRTDTQIVIAQSFGCQLFSCYMWDNWKSDNTKAIKRFFTTGCNIPVFISGMDKEDIVPFSKPNKEFRWLNFWYSNDILGYPLQKINDSYNILVEDHKMKGFAWPVMSHTKYDKKKQVYKTIAKEINSFKE